ncbi:MAG: TraR/DksA C4-type zinc finger protein [Candidatus Doudnabacteria bacterium]
MNKILIEENKAKLLAEQKRLKTMLDRDDVVDSEIPGGHKPKFIEAGSEDSENAQESEQFGDDLSVTVDLEARLKKVDAALNRIQDGTYGKCAVGGEEIEEARLGAEPAADTCVKHAR